MTPAIKIVSVLGADVGEQVDLQNSTDQTPLLTPSPRQEFNSQKFVLQWLGIGYGYSKSLPALPALLPSCIFSHQSIAK